MKRNCVDQSYLEDNNSNNYNAYNNVNGFNNNYDYSNQNEYMNQNGFMNANYANPNGQTNVYINPNANDLELAISSIKVQKFQKLYPLERGFIAGTIFQQLDKPWGERR